MRAPKPPRRKDDRSTRRAALAERHSHRRRRRLGVDGRRRLSILTRAPPLSSSARRLSEVSDNAMRDVCCHPADPRVADHHHHHDDGDQDEDEQDANRACRRSRSWSRVESPTASGATLRSDESSRSSSSSSSFLLTFFMSARVREPLVCERALDVDTNFFARAVAAVDVAASRFSPPPPSTIFSVDCFCASDWKHERRQFLGVAA